MRITTGMFYNDLLQNIQQNLEPMLTSQEELSTGYKMNKPSDNPADLGTVMSLSSMLDQNASETTVLTTQLSRLGETDSALGQATTILNRAYTLVEEADNSAITSGETTDMAQEVKQLMSEMVDTANQTRGTGPGETFYQFNDGNPPVIGRLNSAPTVQAATVQHDTVNPDTIYDSAIPNVTTSPNSTPAPPGTPPQSAVAANSVFAVLQDVYYDLANNGTPPNAHFGTDIQNLQTAVNWVTAQRAQVGAVEDRLQAQQTQIANQNMSLAQLMAGFKDTDIESATVKFSQEQATYQAALETSAKIMQISLTNYLQV